MHACRRRRAEGEEQERLQSPSASQRKKGDGNGERVLYTFVRSGCGFPFMKNKLGTSLY